MKASLIAGALVLSMLAAVWPGTAGSQDGNTAGPHRRPSPPGTEVGFVNLKDGDTIPSTFQVSFFVNGMGIAPAGTDIENTGHHHLLIDQDPLPDPNLPLPMSDKVLHFGKGQTETTLELPAGEHTLQLVFADYLHIPHDPVVKSDRITVTVAGSQ